MQNAACRTEEVVAIEARGKYYRFTTICAVLLLWALQAKEKARNNTMFKVR